MKAAVTLPGRRHRGLGGGLEAFGELLKHLPRDTGMAFILIQHLDPSHESMLTASALASAPMPIHEAEDGVEYAPNCAYVIPPNTYLAITDGILRLTPRPETRGAPMPIDYFFRSLAEQVGSMSIGIVLSGTGSDGSERARRDQGQGRAHLRTGRADRDLSRDAARGGAGRRRGLRASSDGHRGASWRGSPAPPARSGAPLRRNRRGSSTEAPTSAASSP